MNHLMKSVIKKAAHVFFAFSLFAVLLLYPSTVLHAEESHSVTDMNSTATVGDSTLNVRSGPGKEYDALGHVSPGDTLTVTGETDNGWYRIDFTGKEGYVFSDYVTIGDASGVTSNLNDPNDFVNYEEGSPQTDSILTTSPKMLILLGVIIIIIAIMIGTIIMIKKSDEDEYDEYDDDDMYYEDEDEEYNTEDEDGYDEDDDTDEDEEEEEDSYYEEPVRRKKHTVPPAPAMKHTSNSAKAAKNTERSAAPKAVKNSATPIASTRVSPEKPIPRMITEEDYTLQIDPRIFDDEKLVTSSDMVESAPEVTAPKETDAAILSKLEELQKEVERLKNERT